MSALWCDGRERTGTRPLSGEETTWARRKIQRALARMGAGGSCIVLPFVLAILLFIEGHPRGAPRPRFDQLGNVALIAWTLIFLPAGILLVRDAVRHRGRLSRDLAGGSVWTFADVSVLPISRVFVAPQERRGRSAKVAAAAPRPESYYPVPFEVVHGLTGEMRRAMQRRLSEEEARELTTHAQAGWWTWWLLPPAVLWTGWIAAAFRGKNPALGALGVVGFAWISFRLWRNTVIRRALRKDAAAGVAVVIPGREAEPEHEFLPESGSIWTVAGAPAGWRLSEVARDG